MTSTTPPAPAGWHPDPTAPGQLRWYDGSSWTAHTAPAAAASGPVERHHDDPYLRVTAPGLAQAAPTGLGTTLLPHPGGAVRSPGSHPSDPVHWLLPTGRSLASIAAGYAALFAMFIWVLGPVSLGLGILALRAARHGGNGLGRAWFAVVVGAASTVAALAVGFSLLRT